jgi:hypothetical protein
MRSLHEHAIQRMFDGERLRVDAFIDQRWAPEFLRNYVGITDIISTVATRRTISGEREQDLAGALKGYLADTTEAPRAAQAVVTAIERDRSTEPTAIRRESSNGHDRPSDRSSISVRRCMRPSTKPRSTRWAN